MSSDAFIKHYRHHPLVEKINLGLIGPHPGFRLKGLIGSSKAMVLAGLFASRPSNIIAIITDKESAAYFLNDLEAIFGESDLPFHKKRVLFFPTSYRRPYELEKTDNSNVLLRTEVLKRFSNPGRPAIAVTYPEALGEKVISQTYLKKHTFRLKIGEPVDMDFVTDLLLEYNFERVDFVVEPGQFSIRGGLVDVYSYSNDHPYRIEFGTENVESIRSFDPASQLSIDRLDHITLIPNVQDRQLYEKRGSIFKFIPDVPLVWIEEPALAFDRIEKEFEKANDIFSNLKREIAHLQPAELFCSRQEFLSDMLQSPIIQLSADNHLADGDTITFNTAPQPVFNKNFDLLINHLRENAAKEYQNFILAANPKQIDRIRIIIEDLLRNRNQEDDLPFNIIQLTLHEGFTDHDLQLACFTDHQIFDRYQKFRLRDGFASRQAFTLKEIYDLRPGDYITHLDHGVGRFDGLEKIDVNGRQQEALRLAYKDTDLLYISIHSLHRISKYMGKDGTPPNLDRLGSNAWKNLKSRTKQKVKDIARELIKLYAQRKASQGFSFSPDTYMQHELEASFIYEDTPDQYKTTQDVKTDMESYSPMDRLVCGDVGFGKTEIAIRAAFKAVADSKQVAVLVPTTILALQHFQTFGERLADFPCRVDYLNRFKSSAQQKLTLHDLKEGRIDILIGTHRLLSKDVEFKDLGLLIIDEEQKFGVAAKERLRRMKVSVDTLTLTATPIPRTLQFSMMGSRDLSIINTPPPNRYPIETEIRQMNEELIRDAIHYEISRGGQAFFVNNRVQNIHELAGKIQRIVPDAKIAIAHGQMEGAKLEKVMINFIEGRFDVLVATTIIESGLDIPNVNTIIINDAHHYGLSDLHQLRGRVGRTNKKAFCYLLAPPHTLLTDEARKRLRAIEEFSEIGSGFNIAMRDLDIRGAGNILGAEQSGFISEIGFEMYQRILNEAISELKDNEFRDLLPEQTETKFVKDCQIETDLEILIPGEYITNTTERLSLYKELDGIENEDGLMAFGEKLADRFGPIPAQAYELINTIRLRWVARDIGFEKIVLKNNLLTCYFISNPESAYFQSNHFTNVLTFIQSKPQHCRMKEVGNKLSLTFKDVKDIASAIYWLRLVRDGGEITV
ncbi:MAG: transcription-repair coupling factor [Bacteroidales bacterium]|nr:transcription-repair coupling factor [Bacteroidales bacterium]MDZ4203392.1 transcription-repair coupling factor [Bacteroidales bacterium]